MQPKTAYFIVCFLARISDFKELKQLTFITINNEITECESYKVYFNLSGKCIRS